MAAKTSVLGQCRSCEANVLWLMNEATRRIAPIDADTDPKGNIEVDVQRGTYNVVSKVTAPDKMHTNHFQTCPDQARWRERQDKAKAARA